MRIKSFFQDFSDFYRIEGNLSVGIRSLLGNSDSCPKKLLQQLQFHCHEYGQQVLTGIELRDHCEQGQPPIGYHSIQAPRRFSTLRMMGYGKCAINLTSPLQPSTAGRLRICRPLENCASVDRQKRFPDTDPYRSAAI